MSEIEDLVNKLMQINRDIATCDVGMDSLNLRRQDCDEKKKKIEKRLSELNEGRLPVGKKEGVEL